MVKKMKKLLAILLAALMLVSVTACNTKVEDSLSTVKLDIVEEDDTFVGEKGTFKYEYLDTSTLCITQYIPVSDSLQALTIPSEMNGKKVVEIGAEAFKNISAISSVTVPATITKIGEQAFVDCDNLKSVTLPASLTVLGSYAFAYCDALETVAFTGDEKLTSIGQSAFHHCVALSNIVLPATVAEIGTGAFMGCTALESLNLSYAGLTKIGDSAFMNCTGLANVELSQSLVYCGAYAFGGCVDTTFTFLSTDGWNAEGLDVDVSTSAKAYDVLVDEYFNFVLTK